MVDLTKEDLENNSPQTPALKKTRIAKAKIGAGFDAFKAAGGQIIAADAALVKAVADRTARFEQEWVKAVNEKGMNGAAIVTEYRAELTKVAAGQ